MVGLCGPLSCPCSFSFLNCVYDPIWYWFAECECVYWALQTFENSKSFLNGKRGKINWKSKCVMCPSISGSITQLYCSFQTHSMHTALLKMSCAYHRKICLKHLISDLRVFFVMSCSFYSTHKMLYSYRTYWFNYTKQGLNFFFLSFFRMRDSNQYMLGMYYFRIFDIETCCLSWWVWAKLLTCGA